MKKLIDPPTYLTVPVSELVNLRDEISTYRTIAREYDALEGSRWSFGQIKFYQAQHDLLTEFIDRANGEHGAQR